MLNHRLTVTLYLQRQIIEADFEGISLRHYLRTAKPPKDLDSPDRLRLRASLLHISDLRLHHPERELNP